MSHFLREEKQTGFGGENLKRTDHLKDLGVCRLIILKCIPKKWVGMVWTAVNWRTVAPNVGLFEHVFYKIR